MSNRFYLLLGALTVAALGGLVRWVSRGSRGEPVAGAGGVAFTVDGVVRCQQSEPEATSRTSEFHVAVSKERWFISLRPQHISEQDNSSFLGSNAPSPSITPREWVASFDGTNCYYLTVLPTNTIAAGQPDATGEFVLGSTPKRGNPDLAAVWYAYASGHWLSSHTISNGQELPLLGDPLLPVVRSEVTLDALAPFLPVSVGASNVLLSDRGLRWSEKKFRRLASTNVGSLSLASRCEMAYSGSFLGRNYYLVDLAVRQARPGADREVFVPASSGYVQFYTRDIRPVSGRVAGVGLTLTNPTAWPSKDRFRAVAAGGSRAGASPPESRLRRNLVRLTVVGVLLAALAALSAVVVAKRRRERGRAQRGI